MNGSKLTMTPEETVKQLHQCNDMTANCQTCCFYRDDRCMDKLQLAAADTIETLLNVIHGYSGRLDELRKESAHAENKTERPDAGAAAVGDE